MANLLKRTSKAGIKANMEQILQWVEAGYTLRSIHRTLVDKGEISCEFSNFTTHYYAFKKTRLSTGTKTVISQNEVNDQINTGGVENVVLENNHSDDEAQRLANIVFRKKNKLT